MVGFKIILHLLQVIFKLFVGKGKFWRGKQK